MTTTMTPDEYPRLVAAPAMTVDEIIAASEMQIHPPRTREGGIAYLQPNEAHRFTLRTGKRDIVFPPSLFTAIELGRGRVARLRNTPQLDYLAPDAAAALASEVRRLLREADFIEAEVLEGDALRDSVAADGEARAARVRTGEWLGEVRVERVFEAKTLAAEVMQRTEDACLVVCLLWDIRGVAALLG